MNIWPAKTLIRELQADLETPISVYLKIQGNQPSYLLESVDGGEIVARYSFIGTNPLAQYILYTDRVIVIQGGISISHILKDKDDPFLFLERELKKYKVEKQDGLPRFSGGMVGYICYEIVQFFEPSLKGKIPLSDSPIGHFMLSDTVITFDHVRRSLSILTHIFDGDEKSALSRLDDLQKQIQSPLPFSVGDHLIISPLKSNKSHKEFEENVRKAKEFINAGDIFQVVLSQRISKTSDADPFSVYRNVRRLNPSPYMYFFNFRKVNGKDFSLVGASPEMLVRLEDETVTLRPIAGTRKRGITPAEDDNLEVELKNDTKENAEHVMLVDLGRNDLGRVCKFGSIKVTKFGVIEKYSHVMHMVSNLTGKLMEEKNAFDLVRATFPAGTVSGAPKIKAMEIIAELESSPRGVYAGMVGYFGFDGTMDGCIAIRTLVVDGKNFSVQAGAGIVADSKPESEYFETISKASAMLKAIELTENS